MIPTFMLVIVRVGSLEDFFGAGDAGDAWVYFTGLLEGSGEPFEEGFRDVVAVSAVEDFCVDVGT